MSGPLSHLSISADLDLPVVIPWVEDVLGALEGKVLLMDPLNTENPSKSLEIPLMAALLMDD